MDLVQNSWVFLVSDEQGDFVGMAKSREPGSTVGGDVVLFIGVNSSPVNRWDSDGFAGQFFSFEQNQQGQVIVHVSS